MQRIQIFNVKIKTTKSMLKIFDFLRSSKGQTGEITIIFLLLLSTIIIFVTLISFHIKKNIVEQRELLNAKLCKNKVVSLHLDYVNSIAKANRVILFSNIGHLIPGQQLTSTSIKKIISYAQEVKYYYYLSSVLYLDECPKNVKLSFIEPRPYKRGLKGFKREKTGSVKIKSSSYSISSCFKNLNLVIGHHFELNFEGTNYQWDVTESAHCL